MKAKEIVTKSKGQILLELRLYAEALEYVDTRITEQINRIHNCISSKYCEGCCQNHETELKIWRRQQEIILKNLKNLLSEIPDFDEEAPLNFNVSEK